MNTRTKYEYTMDCDANSATHSFLIILGKNPIFQKIHHSQKNHEKEKCTVTATAKYNEKTYSIAIYATGKNQLTMSISTNNAETETMQSLIKRMYEDDTDHGGNQHTMILRQS